MTEPFSKARNDRAKSMIAPLLLLLILAVATALRVYGLNFGLPALNDPDEPLFMMTAFDMLRNQSVNPGWFGHPGTITLYCLALTCVLVGAFGLLTGRYADVDSFVSAVYADPGLVWLPARLFIAICGILCVLLTYHLGKRLGGKRLGLIAAAVLAVNAVHIEYSQIIRTDMQASVFMLLCTLSALAITREGKTRQYVLAGIFVGLATATKWPAAVIALNPICAGLWRLAHGMRGKSRLVLFGMTAAVTLFATSPFLLIDYQTVLRDVAGEARPIHPGATSEGFFASLAWYATNPLVGSFGVAGLALAMIGLLWIPFRDRKWAVAALPGALMFLIVICAQNLLWERWIGPILPFFALGIAFALCALGDYLRGRFGDRARFAAPVALALLLVPMLNTNRISTIERTHDTRQMASAWIRGHAPPGSTVLVEDAAIDLLHDGTRLLFPLGAAGCIDAKRILAGRIKYSQVETARSSSPIVDLGHMDMSLLPSCRADYALLTHYERYRANPVQFAEELRRYRHVMRNARVETVFRPEPGKSSGPIVHVLAMGEK